MSKKNDNKNLIVNISNLEYPMNVNYDFQENNNYINETNKSSNVINEIDKSNNENNKDIKIVKKKKL